jgi:exoribonuclease II
MRVFYEEEGSFKVATVMSESESSFQVESLSGKRSKIKSANVLLKFEGDPSKFMDEMSAEANQLEVDFLWECCPEEEFGFEALAKDYYGQIPTPAQSAAVISVLHGAPMYFYRKGKGKFKAAPPETLKAALASVEKKRLQAEKIASYVRELKAKAMPSEFMPSLAQLIYHPDKNTIEWKALDQVASELKLSPIEVLDQAGGIPSHHDYHLGAFLNEFFPEGADFPNDLETPIVPNDLPQASAKAFSIDDATTTEIDDAFTCEKMPGGMTRVGIHIAAPALGILPHSSLDEVAMKRLSTVYMPGHKLTMLPNKAIEPFSLNAGYYRPALSLYLDVAEDYSIINRFSQVEAIFVEENLRHDSLEPYFNENTLTSNPGHPYWEKLVFLFNLAESLEKKRGKYDPHRPVQIDYSFYVDDGVVSIVGRRRGSPMDKLVAELMIEANRHWGAEIKDKQWPGLYRAQNGGRVYMTTKAEAHQGLGVEQYAWSTSPLRRAADLVNQRQMLAILRGEESPYPKHDEIAVILRRFEVVYQSYAEFQSRMERYWCLEYLRQHQLKEVNAVVLRDNLVRLTDLPYVSKVFNLPLLNPGTLVRLNVKSIDTLIIELGLDFIAVDDTDAAHDPLIEGEDGIEGDS